MNLQTALNAWAGADGRTVEVPRLVLLPHFGGLILAQLTAVLLVQDPSEHHGRSADLRRLSEISADWRGA